MIARAAITASEKQQTHAIRIKLGSTLRKNRQNTPSTDDNSSMEISTRTGLYRLIDMGQKFEFLRENLPGGK